jgi:diguanylate cyclase (GGDEF)-like protein
MLKHLQKPKTQKKQRASNDFYDPLTHLPMRTLFLDRVGQAIEHVKRSRAFEFAILSVDLDRFKRAVNSLGYTMGDQLIMETASRLRLSVRSMDTVARLEGNEYAILLENCRDMAKIIRIVKRVTECLSVPFFLETGEVFLKPFLGIAMIVPGYRQPEEVLRDAHSAMVTAKTSRKKPFEFFDNIMRSQAEAMLKLERDLRIAVELDEFRLHYQPIVDLLSGALTGFEALIRWEHPERGLVPPNDFIPMAEETGLILPMGRWVLREACRQMVRWQKRYPDAAHLAISVNLSVKQFMDENLLENILQTLSETGFDPHRLRLEITESVLMDNLEAALAVLTGLKSHGIQLDMDDFGTGYSSLSNLHRFPVDTLKIDRSFIQNMGQTGGKHEIVRTIITLARDLGMGVTAEGIETAEQLEKLRFLNCKEGQGFFFSKPLEEKKMEHLFSSDLKW